MDCKNFYLNARIYPSRVPNSSVFLLLERFGGGAGTSSGICFAPQAGASAPFVGTTGTSAARSVGIGRAHV